MSIHRFGPFVFARIYGVDKEHDTVYLTRVGIGRLRLHIFNRGDEDLDPHDHPWAFWTFPLVGYVEEVTQEFGSYYLDTKSWQCRWEKRLNNVRSWQWHYRPATHTHRVIGPIVWWRWPIITIVWVTGKEREWGFLRKDCWVPWRKYVYEGGKTAPCADIEGGKPR